MKRILIGTLLALVLTAGMVASDRLQAADEARGVPAGHIALTPEAIEWRDAPALPPGAKIAWLEGDAARPGPFTFRVRMPANYKVPAHSHPVEDRITVLSGTLYMAEGASLDRSRARALPAGSFAVTPAGATHTVWTREPVEIQVHGVGPWGTTYVNPRDDPRKR